MKIAYDAKRLFLNNTGLGNYSRTLLSSLGKHHSEHQYYLFTPDKGSRYTDFSKLFSTKVPEGVWSFLPNHLWRTFGIPRVLNRIKAEIYHGLSQELPYGIENATCKSVVTIHDFIFKLYPQFYKKPDIAIYDKKMHMAIETADHIVCISEQTAKDLDKFYDIKGRSVSVIYQSAASIYETYDPALANVSVITKYSIPDHYVISVGMNERKNLESIIEAMRILKHQSKDFPALVAVGGINDYQMRLQQMADEYGLSEKVFFPKKVQKADLPDLYHHAVASIYPSLYEGFGIPIIESLHSRTPVITNKSGCFNEAAGPGGIYINPENHQELADAILQLENAQMREQLSAEGYEFVQKFNSKTISHNWISLYEQLLR
jgi:glycosyltransferase involved in cell wall biosynthesis